MSLVEPLFPPKLASSLLITAAFREPLLSRMSVFKSVVVRTFQLPGLRAGLGLLRGVVLLSAGDVVVVHCSAVSKPKIYAHSKDRWTIVGQHFIGWGQ